MIILRLSSSLNEEEISFEIEDNGIGIDEERLKNL